MIELLRRLWRRWVGKPIDWDREPSEEYTNWLEDNGPR